MPYHGKSNDLQEAGQAHQKVQKFMNQADGLS